MNNPKHTKGPWTVEYRQDGKLGIKAGSACLIATVGRQAASHVENAYLIAAAPELLEALCSIYYLANLEPHLKTKYSSQTVQMIMQQMADAIAKATGGSNE